MTSEPATPPLTATELDEVRLRWGRGTRPAPMTSPLGRLVQRLLATLDTALASAAPERLAGALEWALDEVAHLDEQMGIRDEPPPEYIAARLLLLERPTLDRDRAARDALSVERLAALEAALRRFVPDDPWAYVPITTESYQPPNECLACGSVMPRLRKDRDRDEAHEADCAWVAGRKALAASPSRAPEDERPDCAHRPGYEHGHWCAQGGSGDSEWMAFEHGEACSRSDAPPERAAISSCAGEDVR